MSLASTRAEAMEFARGLANNAVSSLVDAAQQHAARKRCEACTEMIFHERMVQLLPGIRWIARLHHKRMAKRCRAYCDALRAKGDLVAISICAERRVTT